MGVYTLSYPLVGYTIGLMQSSNWYYNDFTVWAVFLLLLLSSTDSLTACRLNDIDSWKSIFVKQLFKGYLLLLVVYKFGRDMENKMEAHYLWYPLSAILVLSFIKSYVMTASMRVVSKSYLGKKVKVIAEYMQYIDKRVEGFDPVTMEGYRYMVAGENHCVNRRGCTPWYNKPEDLKVTTVEQIWQCNGNLLITGDRGKALKDLCLSMALSKMLSRRFAGFKLSDKEELEKTRDFIFNGLLAGDEPHLRAFRVVEEELVFVHDMYYTRYSYLYQKGGYLALCLPVIMICLCSWLTVTCLHVRSQEEQYPNVKHIRMMSSTIVVMLLLAFLEAYQMYLYIASGWFKVALIRSYVNAPDFLQRCCCFEMIIRLLLIWKAFGPWKGRLGQYCLLENLGHRSRMKNCLHYTTLRLVDKARKGSKKSVKLSENVKKAVVDYLKLSGGHLTKGVKALENNGVHDLFAWACSDATATDGAVTRTILVWHIATTLCEQQLDEKAKKLDAVKTASKLSKYCMHLIAFAPDLLPDHSSISESILGQSIDEAGKLLKESKETKIKGSKGKKMKSRCEALMKINTDDCVGDETKLVEQGVHLARLLTDRLSDSTSRWKVLSDFWAEMMLYVSPSDDAREHLEVLARGGEFITHLWVLLTHAGVLRRGHE
jgi:hypothetical protein